MFYYLSVLKCVLNVLLPEGSLLFVLKCVLNVLLPEGSLLFVLKCVLNVLLPEGSFVHRHFVVVLLCVLNVLLPPGNFCTPSFIIKFAGCFTVRVTSTKANLCTPIVSKLRCIVSAVLCQQSVNYNVLSVMAMPTTLPVAIINCQ